MGWVFLKLRSNEHLIALVPLLYFAKLKDELYIQSAQPMEPQVIKGTHFMAKAS